MTSLTKKFAAATLLIIVAANTTAAQARSLSSGGFNGGGISRQASGFGSSPIMPRSGPSSSGITRPVKLGGFSEKLNTGSVYKPGPVVIKPPVGCKGLCKPPKPIPTPPPAPHKPKHGHGGWAWGGITILATSYNGCGYEYYKWQSTGSPKWRAAYHECRAD